MQDHVSTVNGRRDRSSRPREASSDQISLDPTPTAPNRRSKRLGKRPANAQQPKPPLSKSYRLSGAHQPGDTDKRNAEKTIDDLLKAEENQDLLLYFDKTVCNTMVIDADGVDNPFRSYILPLAYRDLGILHAVLALSSCHIVTSESNTQAKVNAAIMIEHQLSALQSLSSLLLKEELYSLADEEEDILLATVLLLVLHDVCESGISSHGVHLTGTGFICRKICQHPQALASPRTTFLLTALSWLDVLRGFSGAEKMAYTDDVRRFILETEYFSLETLVGCPVDLFYNIGGVLEAAKQFMDGSITLGPFQTALDEADLFFREWNPEESSYPTQSSDWKALAEAYRHVCIIRVLRFPDTRAIPCEDPRIQASVVSILDASASISTKSPFFKRLLFPLFIAGCESSIPHQKRYVDLCIDEIKKTTGFQHLAMTNLLDQVWDARKQQIDASINIPWMEYTCSTDLVRQHDYLFF
ncbi:hypothetical protein P170DRAFT_263112 [Aspergillus steynii IBT 23096]|uniref:C6 transcription factor n=1 Tax=Aspergillus steynii IBT 23096 TaxID=1392250 RepID=A0A2I2G019_9EURO|nr:uncharacterized protein P170DRAFT_263112 [Aspergillus steynii IBT 23096]PLB46242.1 hypothetical protein P170DRAFT_263112 [Aspergillus steynii IBT 23096]